MANPRNYVHLPREFRCTTCKDDMETCYVSRSTKSLNGSAGIACACCQDTGLPCSLSTLTATTKQLQAWLDAKPVPAPLLPSESANETPPRASPQQGDPPVDPNQPMTVMRKSTRTIKIVTPSSSIPKSPPSTPLSSSPRVGSNRIQSCMKRSWNAANPSLNKEVVATSKSKTVRLDAPSISHTPSGIEDTDHQGTGEDPEFKRLSLALADHHTTIIKTRQTAVLANEKLKEEVEKMKGRVEGLMTQKVELETRNTRLVAERDVKAATIKIMEAEREGDKLFWQREREQKDAMIAKTDVERARWEVQHDQAVSNADASRLARNEAEEELRIAKEDVNRLSNESKEKTDALEIAEIDLEESQQQVKLLRNECSDRIAVKADLATVQRCQEELKQKNARLATDLESANEKIAELQCKASIADDRLIERNEMEEQLAITKIRVEEQAEELAAANSRLEKYLKAKQEIQKNFRVAHSELFRVIAENRILQGGGSTMGSRVKQEGGGFERDTGGNSIDNPIDLTE